MNGIKYRKPEEMKDSGIEWLGMVPKDWDLIKLKFLSKYKASNVDKFTVDGERPVLLCNYVDVYKNRVINEQLDFMQATATKREITNYSLMGGYILVTKDSESPDDIGIPAYVPDTLPGVLCGYHLSIIDADATRLNPKYLFNFLTSQGVGNYFETKAKGITRYSLNMESFKNIIIPNIRIKEQQKIANFLDIKTAQFDSIIAKKELLVQKLEEAKKSLISEVVTGQVKIIDGEIVQRKSEEMKDSGVEWLGMIPKNWEIKRLKYLIEINPVKSEIQKGNQICSFVPMNKLHNGIVETDEERVVSEVYDGYTYFRTGDIIMAKVTPCFENGNIAIADNLINSIGFGSTEINVFRVGRFYDKTYIYYSLQENHFMRYGSSHMTGVAGLKRIPTDYIANYSIAVPDFYEQRLITNYIDRQITNIKTIKGKITEQINKLKQAKQSLISEAVTGKIDLRDWEIIEEVGVQ